MNTAHNNIQTSEPLTPSLSLKPETLALLRNVPVLESLDNEKLHCLDGADERYLKHEEILIAQGETARHFWILLEGSIRIYYTNPDGIDQTLYLLEQGASFGEVPLLANVSSAANLQAQGACHLLQLSEDQFWNLLTLCPDVRKAILGNMAQRLAKVQDLNFRQEKMASLGIMAAGLMHELNNPGAAARRASSQLRENILRMHQLTAKFARTSLTEQQKQWMFELQDYALAARPASTLTSLEEADAEEALTHWMESAGIKDSWKLAPRLASIGFDQQVLDCAKCAFEAPVFSDALSWLEALVSSMQLVGTIEESIGRVTELVEAVKSYAYEGKGKMQSVDVNNSIHATLVVLGHKLREKQITVDKHFAPELPLLQTGRQGLNQIWTNLIDNAIDAAPQHGHISVKTWSETREPHSPDTQKDEEKSPVDLCILVSDNGCGIPLESQPLIFDPFYTTKPVGIGTGLGLGIVYRVVEQYGGVIHFSSTPGATEFIVRLPSGHL